MAIHRPSFPRFNEGGNYCGHRPDSPRIALTQVVQTGKGGLPGIITTLMKRCVDYYDRPWKIPSLNNADGAGQQQRSERREACLSALWAILKYTDLSTLRVGVPARGGEFINLSIRYLANQTSLSRSRFERAFSDLKTAGIISVQQRCEKKEDGGYAGLSAVKRVSPLIFSIFGLGARLKFERGRAKKRAKQARRACSRTERARRQLTTKSIVGEVASQVSSAKKAGEPSSPDEHTEEQRRQLLELQFQIKQANPEWGAGAVQKAARRTLEMYESG